MLELKNVSKFYSNNGMVSTGFSRVSLKFNLGEFVAITGESGSGKSTLLNVISGLDSYEEGEMFINGKETSHYTEKDYEIYRRKYVGNIFQNFNLVNSYTVYQNIELVLLLNGKDKKDIKEQVNSLINQVDLNKYRNTKVSKLSGGQKQRVAIARALAMNTPIILADEPTGNLDKSSSESVLKLLHDISKDKLVIVVTHNYDQIEKYVTRKITMNDGRVLEDKKVRNYEEVEVVQENKFSDIKWVNKICLGVRNAFNIPSKLFLVTAVYFFIVISIFGAYSAFQKFQYEISNEGVNTFFTNTSDKRIVIKKKDKSSINENDYKKISDLENIESIVKSDVLLDEKISISNGEYLSFYGTVSNISNIDSVLYGKMPTSDDEIVLGLYEDDYYLEYEGQRERVLNQTFTIDSVNGEEKKVKVVGLTKSKSKYAYSSTEFYVTDKLFYKLSDNIIKGYTKLSYKFGELLGESNLGYVDGEILPSDKVESGKIVIPDTWQNQCNNFDCKNYKLKVNVNNLYNKFDKEFTVKDSYNSMTLEKLTDYKYDKYNNAIFINTNDYNSLYKSNYYQSSVFVKDVNTVRDTIKSIEDLGYTTLYMPDVLNNLAKDSLPGLRIAKMLVLVILFITLFFISYFIIQLVFKSRNVYYSTLRILGSSLKCTKSLLNIELLTLAHLGYLVFIMLLVFIKSSIINAPLLKDLSTYMTLNNYIVLYIVLLMMSLFITFRYSRKLFKDSVMNTYREEV